MVTHSEIFHHPAQPNNAEKWNGTSVHDPEVHEALGLTMNAYDQNRRRYFGEVGLVLMLAGAVIRLEM